LRVPQNFSHCISNGNVRAKAPLIERLCVIVLASYASKPQLVTKYAIPAAFALLPDAKGDVKVAAQQLLSTLATLMGTTLLETASNLSPANQQKLIEYLTPGGSSRRG
jgi:hypothetical protein